MKTKIIDNFDDFLKLYDAWNELVDGNEVDHAFMKHEWFERWLIDLDYRQGISIITFWQDRLLVGIAQ